MSVTGLWKVCFDAPSPMLAPLWLEGDDLSLDAVSKALPGGAYTTFRTFNRRQALRFQDHLERLVETANLAGHALALDLPALRIATCLAIESLNVPGDLRLRLQLDLEQNPGDVYIAAEPLHIPPVQAYTEGVKTVTVTMQRQTPKAKLTRFIERSGPLRKSLPVDVNEAIMVDAAGYMLEGLTSNFFGVLEGVLWTAEEGVLSGITRSLTLECASRLGLPVRLEPLPTVSIPTLSEAFITSSSRAVLPVRQIDEFYLPAPGKITRQLMDAYEQAVQAQAETI